MNNEDKKWALDRKEEAYEDIIQIADIISTMYEKDMDEESVIIEIYKVLKEGGWV